MSNEELAIRIRNGETDLTEQLWNQVVKFVTLMAKKYSLAYNGRYEVEDLIQSGFIAVVEAAKRYQEDVNGKYLTYLGYWLLHEFRKANGITRARNIIGEVTDENGNVIKLQAYDPIERSESLNTPLGDSEDGDTKESLLADPRDQFEEVEHKIYLEQLRETLDKAMDQLPAEQKQILISYFRDQKTRDEIGEELGKTGSAVDSQKRAALTKLHREKHKNGLDQFVDERTPFYHTVGIREFTATHSSIVEKAVLSRERLERSYNQWKE